MEPQIIDITPEDSVVPVYLAPLTDSELEERLQQDKDDAEQKLLESAPNLAKESAKAKLAALGLTEEEVAALLN